MEKETTCAVATILRLQNFGVDQVYKSQISILKRYRSRRFERKLFVSNKFLFYFPTDTATELFRKLNLLIYFVAIPVYNAMLAKNATKNRIKELPLNARRSYNQNCKMWSFVIWRHGTFVK